MYRYDTHVHTAPASRCGHAGVEETLLFYRDLGFDGIFLTNHFVDGNCAAPKTDPYEKQLDFFFADYQNALVLGKEIGIRAFLGVEITCDGTDFLIYGLSPDFYYAHPELLSMKKSEELPFLRENGALVIHAHPFREAGYIDHIRLFPRCVDGVETLNASRDDFCNRMAEIYAREYGLTCQTAGSDNHAAGQIQRIAGMEFDTPLADEADFIARVRAGASRFFTETAPFDL